MNVSLTPELEELVNQKVASTARRKRVALFTQG